uniref:Uncharacterized protein n=1 Tax=Panagrolaimus superbus TaxID=310955 RepID=A0A914Y772_9BILA
MNNCCFKSFFVFLCFQLVFFDPIFAAKLQRHENVSNDSFTLDRNDAINEQQLHSDILLADGSVNGMPDGNDVRLSGYGSINLTLTDRTLQFEVCDSCRGRSKVCFDTAKVHSEAICPGYSSYCKFEVEYKKSKADGIESIYFNDDRVYKSNFNGDCLRPTMHWGLVVAVGTSGFKSCKPKIDGLEKMIKLYVDIDASCPIKVKNAKIHVPDVPTANPLSNSTTDNEFSTASVPVWAIVIMVLGGIAVILIIGGFV